MESEFLCIKKERNKEFAYAAVKFTNDTGLTLEAGPVTVFEEETYAGECLADVIKPDDKRIMPYALDKSVSVVVRTEYDHKPIDRLTFNNGILLMYSKQISSVIYNIENLSTKDKVIYVEHPVKSGWKLDSGMNPEETTRNFYRFPHRSF